MEPKNQKNVSLVLLISLFLQSCGVDVPREPENKQVSGEELTNPVTQNGTTAHGSIETCGEQDICTQSALSGATHVFDASKEPEIASVHRLSDQEIMQYVQKSPTKSTQELVKDFNQPVSNPKERLALHAWVQSYIHWFYDQAVESLGTEQCKEYAYLAHIQPRSEADHALLYQYFRSLARNIESRKPVDEHFIQALDNTLQHIAPETFKEHIGELDQVGDILLKQVRPRRTTLSIENYPQHEAMIKALHSILLVMYKLDRTRWDEEESLYTGFQEKMAAIQGASKYYPYSYHAQLLSQGLEILAGCNKHDTAQQVWEGCKAWGCASQMVNQLIGVAPEAVEQVKQRYTELKNDIVHLHEGPAACTWLKRLIDITAASMQVLEDKRQWPAFVERIQALKEDNSIWESEYTEDCRALRYGAVKQLTLLALHSDRAVESLEMLKSFTELAIRYRDQHMMEAIFESVLAVAKSEQTGLQREGAADTARSYLLSLQEEGDKAASQLLEPISKRPRLDMGTSSESRPDTAINLPPKALVSAMKKWLKGTTLEEKLNPAKPCDTAPRQDFIFKAVRTAWVTGTRVGESLQQPRESTLSEEAEIQDINQDEEEQEEREIAFFHQFIELLDRYDYDEIEIFDLEIDLQALCRKHSHYLGSSLLSRKYAWADEQYTPLQFAARQGNLHMVKELCSEKYKEYKREDVEIEKCNKEMALHCAAAGGHVPTIVYLIEKQQVDVNARDEEGASVLHYAAYGKHISAVNRLLSYPKIDINVSDRNGLSVLHVAAYAQSVDLVKLFLSKMQLRLINSADEDGKQAVDYAGPETKYMFTLAQGKQDGTE